MQIPIRNISLPGDITDFHICRLFCACLDDRKKNKKGDLEETGHRQNVSKKSDTDAAKSLVKNTLVALQETAIVCPNLPDPAQSVSPHCDPQSFALRGFSTMLPQVPIALDNEN